MCSKCDPSSLILSRLVSLTLSRCLQCDEIQYHTVRPRPVSIFSDPVFSGQFLKSRGWPVYTGWTVIDSNLLITLKSTAHAFYVCLFYSLIKSLQLTLSGSKADIMFLVDVPQNKWAGDVNGMIWIDDYITVKTADHTNRSFVAVCCGTENQVIVPCAILFHASQVISPRWVSMDKVKQICSIEL